MKLMISSFYCRSLLLMGLLPSTASALVCGLNSGDSCTPLVLSPSRVMILDCTTWVSSSPGSHPWGCSGDICYPNMMPPPPAPIPGSAVAYCNASQASTLGINPGYYNQSPIDYNGTGPIDLEYRHISSGPTPTPPAGGTSSFTFTPSSHAFGLIPVNTFSTPTAITITNTGTTTQTGCIVGITNSTDYTITGGELCTDFTPGGSCTVILKAKPNSTGSKTTKIVINCGLPIARLSR